MIIPHMRTCHAFFPAGVLLVIPGSAHAQAATVLASRQFDVDGMHSTVGFTARILRFEKVRGRFRRYDVALTYDSAHLERSSVTAIIVAKSIDTDMDFRDNHLRSPDFFPPTAFPPSSFTATESRVRHHRSALPTRSFWCPRWLGQGCF